MKDVEEFIFQKEGRQRDLLLFLHNMMVNNYQLIPKIRYKIPFYYKSNWMLYLNPLKNGGVDLAVIRAIEQNEIHELLDFKGRKQVASLELKPDQNLPEMEIKEIIEAAIFIEEKSLVGKKGRNNKNEKR